MKSLNLFESMRLPGPSWARWILFLILGAGAIALVRDTAAQGNDYSVFWRAAERLLRGLPIYELGGDPLVFKYPPWVLPFLAPLGMVSLPTGAWIWGILQVFSLAYVVRWCLLRGFSSVIVYGCLLLFWGIWAVHALDGQISLMMLALALWSWNRRTAWWASFVFLWSLTVKVFNLTALPGYRFSARQGLIAVGLLGVLSLPALSVDSGGDPIRLASRWYATAMSGGDLLAGEQVRNRENQGIPALVLRKIGVPAKEKQYDLVVFFAVALVLGALWFWRSRGLDSDAKFLSWLALSAALHPLAWFHGFVFAFPIGVLCVHRNTGVRRVLAAFAVVCVAAVTEKTLGKSVGLWIELWSVKSLGVLGCLALLSKK